MPIHSPSSLSPAFTGLIKGHPRFNTTQKTFIEHDHLCSKSDWASITGMNIFKGGTQKWEKAPRFVLLSREIYLPHRHCQKRQEFWSQPTDQVFASVALPLRVVKDSEGDGLLMVSWVFLFKYFHIEHSKVCIKYWAFKVAFCQFQKHFSLDLSCRRGRVYKLSVRHVSLQTLERG